MHTAEARQEQMNKQPAQTRIIGSAGQSVRTVSRPITKTSVSRTLPTRNYLCVMVSKLVKGSLGNISSVSKDEVAEPIHTPSTCHFYERDEDDKLRSNSACPEALQVHQLGMLWRMSKT